MVGASQCSFETGGVDSGSAIAGGSSWGSVVSGGGGSVGAGGDLDFPAARLRGADLPAARLPDADLPAARLPALLPR